MSGREVDRLDVVRKVGDDGAAGLVSKRRGKRSNNVIDEVVRRKVMGWVRRRYADFGPTLAREKLAEVHG